MATYAPRHSPSAFSTPASTTLFRRLTWEGTVPLEIRVDPKELPANSDRGLECYYIQAPRVSYLPLLVPEIKRYLHDVVFDEAAARLIKEEDWWFESEEGNLLKWCVLRSPCLSIQRYPCNRMLIADAGIGPSASSTTTIPSPNLLVRMLYHPSSLLFASFSTSSLRQPRSCCCRLAQTHANKHSWDNSRRPTSSAGETPSA